MNQSLQQDFSVDFEIGSIYRDEAVPSNQQQQSYMSHGLTHNETSFEKPYSSKKIREPALHGFSFRRQTTGTNFTPDASLVQGLLSRGNENTEKSNAVLE